MMIATLYNEKVSIVVQSMKDVKQALAMQNRVETSILFFAVKRMKVYVANCSMNNKILQI